MTQVLHAVNDSQGRPIETLEQQVARLMAENAKLRAARQGKLTLKISDKGALSVYGMGRWPVTLYRGQWERLFDNAAQIKAFIEANADSLSVKE